MLKQISLRIPKPLFDSVNSLSKIEQVERSFLFRQAIQKGVEQLRKTTAIEAVREQTLSLSEAAKLAHVGVGEMMDLLVKNGVKSQFTVEDIAEDLQLAKKIFQR